MNNPEKIKEWSEKVSDFSKSGKSRQDWCKENNISVQQFAYWYGRIAKKQETQWLPVDIIENEANIKESTIQDKNDNLTKLNIKIGVAAIEVSPNIDKELLLDILKTLKSL